ncbi:MAG: ATPase, T2SS/T4P/T4SS family [Kiritimatiellae bacterium]|jgi:pilus assembly protein CpaF|nr:ATPase, T2SS/T4P/T4SS family [Kiritimatiellia bacterium]
MPMLTLIARDGRTPERSVELNPAETNTVGRSPDNHIVLNDPKVSRTHLRLVWRDGACWAEDAGSTFGTWRNGEKMSGPVRLAAGDRLTLGGYELVFDAAAGVPAAAHGKESDGPEDVAMDPALAALAVLYTDEMMAMKKRIHEQVLFKLNLPEIATKQIQDDELRAKLEVALDQVLREVRHELPRDLAHDLFRQTLLDELIGYGPITPMLRDPTVDEVMVNGPSRIFVERKGRLYETGARFFDDRHLITIIQRIVEPLGRHVDEASPMVDARLPDGSRVNAIIPPLALDGSSVTVRKFARRKLTTDDLIAFGSMTPEIALFLEEAVRARQNIVVSGGTGSGKTTLLNVLSQFIPRGERLVTIEDSAELKLSHRNIVRLEARPANIEGRGRVAIRDLVINALRMRPDRIVVGECRGPEALDMLQAMNTGHDGSLTTAHANTPRDCLSRLENMVMMAGFDLPSAAIREQIASAVNLIVQQNRLPDGSRKIVQISEVTGREGATILLQDIFQFEQKGFGPDGKVTGTMVATGNIPQFVEELKAKGDLRLDMSVFVPKA